MKPGNILHETSRRLRLAVAPGCDLVAVRAGLARLPGVQSVRLNTTLRCLVVQYDGHAPTRAAVFKRLRTGETAHRQEAVAAPQRLHDTLQWAPAVLAAAVPLLPHGWRRDAALAAVATRVLTQPERLRQDAPAVLLNVVSLASLAINGQPLVVSASMLLRLLSERLSARFMRHADHLLDHLLPTEAEHYTARRARSDPAAWRRWPLGELRAGDHVRLHPGDTVPVDGWVLDGTATMATSALHATARLVQVGDHVAAGELLHTGTLELRAEADAAASRLERMRAQVHHAIGSRDPLGRMVPSQGSLISLPLTASALVFGLTGNTARSVAMLQGDPSQGLNLALPLAREAGLYALAKQGLLTGGFQAIERLATARTLVLQDTGVLATGHWTVEALHTQPGADPETVRRWLAALADTPWEALHRARFPDRLVRQWVRHGALLRIGEQEVHLASRQRLQRVWGQALESPAPEAVAGRLRRELVVVAAGRVVARVLLASAWRPSALERLDELVALGFDQVAVFEEADGARDQEPNAAAWGGRDGLATIPDIRGLRAHWLAQATSDGQAIVMVHTVLRDLVPPGSLSLTPMDADAGAHGVLLGDPLASLVTARRVARTVHRHVHVQQGTAVSVNAALMTVSAMRWLPPMATTFLHHGVALTLLLDSWRLESLKAPADRPGAATPSHLQKE